MDTIGLAMQNAKCLVFLHNGHSTDQRHAGLVQYLDQYITMN